MMKFKEQEHKKMKNKLNISILEQKKMEEQDSKEKSKNIFIIRHNQILGLQHRKDFLIDKILKIKDDKKNELNEEIKIIDEHKKEFEETSKAEDKMLKKINKISELKNEAFNQLVEIKKMGPDEAYEKYNNKLSMYLAKDFSGSKENTRDFSRDRDIIRDFSRDFKHRLNINSNSTDTLAKKLTNFSALITNSPPLLMIYQNPISKPELFPIVLVKPLNDISKIYSPQFVKDYKRKI